MYQWQREQGERGNRVDEDWNRRAKHGEGGKREIREGIQGGTTKTQDHLGSHLETYQS